MDYKELIAQLRRFAAYYPVTGPIEGKAAAAIETLLAERDAAVEDLHGACRACVYAGCFEGAQPCCDCTYGTGAMSDADNWQWRGLQKEGGA